MRSRRVTPCRPVERKRWHCSDGPPDSSAAMGGGLPLAASEMVEFGVALVLVGAALLVAEAHVPGGVLGVTGGVTLATGAALALAGAGGGAAVVIGAVLGALAATGLWLAFAARKALDARRLRSASGREALAGRCGVVRR